MNRKPKLGLSRARMNTGDIIILALLIPVIIQSLIIILVPFIGLILATLGLI